MHERIALFSRLARTTALVVCALALATTAALAAPKDDISAKRAEAESARAQIAAPVSYTHLTLPTQRIV